MSRSHVLQTLVPLLLAVSLVSPASSLVQGGDPGDMLLYPPVGSDFNGSEPGVAISSTGVIFVSVCREIATFDYELVILRSDTNGQTWTEWSVFTFPAGDSAEDAEIQVVSGTTGEVLVLSFLEDAPPDRIWVYTTDAASASPAWTQKLVETIPWSVGAFPRAYGPALATRPSTTGPPTIGVAYWIEMDSDDFELHYSVSLDGGATFEPPVLLFNPPQPADGFRDSEVELGFGGSGVVYVVSLSTLTSATPEWTKVRLATATNNGATASDWDLTMNLLLDSDAGDHAHLTLASDPLGDDLVIAYRRIYYPNTETFILGSLNGGVDWAPGSIQDPDIDNDFELFHTAAGFKATATGNFLGYHVLRPQHGVVGPYEASEFLRCGWIERSTAQVAVDPTQSNQVAMVAVMSNNSDQEEALWFNAEWRDQPGYAVSQHDWHQSIPGTIGQYIAAPGVADLDGDGLAEIVVADSQGSLKSYSTAYGGTHSYDMGAAGSSSVPVLFDLNGDLILEVVIGGPDGMLHILDNELAPIAWRPHDLGSGSDVYVSAGPVTGMVAGEIVAVSGNAVHLMNTAGAERTGWPQSAGGGTAAGRAAIGDVDDDGQTEIVAVFTIGLAILDPVGVIETFMPSLGVAPSAGVSLADLDGDGDLEIAVPMSDGTVELLHHDGTPMNAAWPYDTGTGSPVIGVTIAKVMNVGTTAICFSTVSGDVFAVNIDGSDLPNYPVSVAAGDQANSEPIIARVARPDTERPQLLVGTTGGWLHEWTALGHLPVDWPNFFTIQPAHAPVAADVDGDGLQEMILATGDQLYVFDTGTAALPGALRQWPMTGYDLARSGCQDCLPATPTSVLDPSNDSEAAAGRTRISFAGASPNPSPGRTTFRFNLAVAAEVELAVYDLRGSRVAGFARRPFVPGDHALNWDGRDDRGAEVASGLYFARLMMSEGGVHRVMTRELVVTR